MKIRRKPLGIQGDGWAAFIGVFCGEHWYSPKSWRRYKKFDRLTYDNGFHIGPILFWKEG
jgi:hypothetical protein